MPINRLMHDRVSNTITSMRFLHRVCMCWSRFNFESIVIYVFDCSPDFEIVTGPSDPWDRSSLKQSLANVGSFICEAFACKRPAYTTFVYGLIAKPLACPISCLSGRYSRIEVQQLASDHALPSHAEMIQLNDRCAIAVLLKTTLKFVNESRGKVSIKVRG